MSTAVEPLIYQLKVVLKGISPMIWRRILVQSDSTIVDLHYILLKPAGKPKNLDRRSREYLFPQKVQQLIDAACKSGRHPHRDATLILLTYRHGLRVS